jgi:phospholipid/cholesterol/gamma-HCH transport system substrate-binding protein
MNYVKFNKFERIAGLFVGIAILSFLGSLIGVAAKQGWFDSKVYWMTAFESGDGVHPGTAVQIQGLKAGSVEEVELTDDNKIHVRFYVLSKFASKIKKDSVVQLIRPFVIGERVLDISVGSKDSENLPPNQAIAAQETMDLMTVMSGKHLGEYLTAMSGMMANLKTFAEAFMNKDRTQSFIDALDRIDPLLKNLNAMSVEVIKLSRQASKDENLGTVLKELATTTKELNLIIPEMNRQAPQMAKQMTQLVGNLAVLTEEFKVIIPALAEVAPDLPQTSRRAVVALDEAVVLIKAMQKSFFVRGNAQEVREEEAEAAKQKKRVPANDK